MRNVTAIFTSFNRKEQSLRCVRSLAEQNPSITFRFIVVDDGSTDGTGEALLRLPDTDLTLVEGNGNLYWCGGMRKGIETFLASEPADEGYCLLANDDVAFYPHSIEKLFDRMAGRSDVVVVGAAQNEEGKFTYGLKCREAWYKKNITKRIEPSEKEIEGETFNANCVLIPNPIIKSMGNLDPVYRHSLGDYDYGFRLSRAGYHLISSKEYVGVCDKNSIQGTWNDTTLSRKERLQKKESPKGSPRKEWWHFLRKNFGLLSAVKYSVIPYIRILLRK